MKTRIVIICSFIFLLVGVSVGFADSRHRSIRDNGGSKGFEPPRFGLICYGGVQAIDKVGETQYYECQIQGDYWKCNYNRRGKPMDIWKDMPHNCDEVAEEYEPLW